MLTLFVLVMVDAVGSAILAALLWEPRSCPRCFTNHYADGLGIMVESIHYCDECKETNNKKRGWWTIWIIAFLFGMIIILIAT